MARGSLLRACGWLIASGVGACASSGNSGAGAPAGAGGSAAGADAGGGTNAAGSAGVVAVVGSSGAAGGAAGASGGSLVQAGTDAGTSGSQSGGGSAAGHAGSGGGGTTAAFGAEFILGADISSAQETSTTYRDVDGSQKSLVAVLKAHGFNYVRLKTFVDPKAPYGYASTANGCQGLPEAYGDRDHVIAAATQAKQAGMGFLLDFHYSDTWADPGNQIIPEAWRKAGNVQQLASFVDAYTRDVVQKAIAAGARPDLVQVGNEITAGMLMHVPGPSTDCWGNDPDQAAIGGSTAHWDDLATLLKAGIAAVRAVDPTIPVMLHIENTKDLAGVRAWIDSARSRQVSFDVLGLSCYVAFQGQPSVWKATFGDLATRYPDLKFAIAEYNPERTSANLIMRDLPDGRGLGTFFWEPTRSGEWGSALFSVSGQTARANAADFQEIDELRPQLGL